MVGIEQAASGALFNTFEPTSRICGSLMGMRINKDNYHILKDTKWFSDNFRRFAYHRTENWRVESIFQKGGLRPDVTQDAFDYLMLSGHLPHELPNTECGLKARGDIMIIVDLHGYMENSDCLLYTSPSPRDVEESRMPSSA